MGRRRLRGRRGARVAATALGRRGARARAVRGAPFELDFARGRNPWRFDSAEHWVTFMETRYDPTVKAREKLASEGPWPDVRAEMVALAERHNRSHDGTLRMNAEYLVTVGRGT